MPLPEPPPAPAPAPGPAPATGHPGLPPVAWALLAGLAVLLAAFVPVLWQTLSAPPRPAGAAAAAADGPEPWLLRVGPDGSSRLMGLHLGADTLDSVQQRLGDALQPALVARLGEPGALEALVDPFAAGFVTGRLVLAFDAPREARVAWHDAAPRSSPMEGGVRRFELTAEARRAAGAMRLVGVSFVPGVRLSADDIRQRFGEPAQRVAAGAAEVWLYPDRGLSIALQPGARPVLQAVVPAEFDARLRQPLLAAGAASAVRP